MSLDDLIESMGVEQAVDNSKRGRAPVTVWLPIDVKADYDEVQGLTNRQASKVLKEAVTITVAKLKAKFAK